METWIGISLVICSTALLRWVQARAVRSTHGEASMPKRLEDRLDAMERRLGDVQEVVLSIDEKLERLDTVVSQ